MTEFVLAVQIEGDTHVLAVEVIDAAGIRCPLRFLLGMDKIFIGGDELVSVHPVVKTYCPFEHQIHYGSENQGVRCLETAHRFPVVLQGLRLVHKCLHPGIFVLAGRIDIRIVAYGVPVRIGVGEVGGSRTLGKPQSGVTSFIAVPAAAEILDRHAERVLVFQPPGNRDTRPESQVIFPVLVGVVYQCTGIIAHAETEAETIFLAASVHRDPVFLIEACLVQQILGSLEIIEL